jgi:hypothetical protein
MKYFIFPMLIVYLTAGEGKEIVRHTKKYSDIFTYLIWIQKKLNKGFMLGVEIHFTFIIAIDLINNPDMLRLDY